MRNVAISVGVLVLALVIWVATRKPLSIDEELGKLPPDERQALEARETKLRESERAASVELMHKSVLGKAPFERVEAFFAALGKLGLDEAEKRLRAS